MFTDVKKKTQKKFDVTILTQVVIGILDLWNASTYRPHRPIVRKIRGIRCVTFLIDSAEMSRYLFYYYHIYTLLFW